MPSASHTTKPSARLLIADDHPLFRQAIRAMLSTERNLEVVAEADNGLRAIEACRQLSPDLVLMDVNMPVMGGLEATRRIKQECPETSVLILTVYEDPDHLWEAIRAGAAGYVPKISTPEELLGAIRGVLRGEWPFDQKLAKEMLGRLRAAQTHDETEEAEALAPRVGGASVPSPEERRGLSAPVGCAPSLPRSLTRREVEILGLVVEGHTNRKIAEELCVARNTARNHVQHIISKLHVSDRTQAAVRAIELGLLCAAENEKGEERY